VFEPEITLTVDLSPTRSQDGSIGEVAGSTWEGMGHREVGQAQAWYYPGDRVLMIWECFLLDPYTHAGPIQGYVAGCPLDRLRADAARPPLRGR